MAYEMRMSDWSSDVCSSELPITDFGVDAVVHSTTKYINGHSDVVGGAVIARTPELHERFAWWANCLGITGAPFDSFLTLRGLRTLDARLRVHQENAAAIEIGRASCRERVCQYV